MIRNDCSLFYKTFFRSLMAPSPAPYTPRPQLYTDKMQIFHLALMHLYCTSRKQSPGRKRTAAAIRWKSVRRSRCSSPFNRKSQPLTRGGAVEKKSCLSLIGDAQQSSGAVSALDKSLRLRFSGCRFLLDGWTTLFFFFSGVIWCWVLEAAGASSWRHFQKLALSCRASPASPPGLAASSGPFFFSFFFQPQPQLQNSRQNHSWHPPQELSQNKKKNESLKCHWNKKDEV